MHATCSFCAIPLICRHWHWHCSWSEWYILPCNDYHGGGCNHLYSCEDTPKNMYVSFKSSMHENECTLPIAACTVCFFLINLTELLTTDCVPDPIATMAGNKDVTETKPNLAYEIVKQCHQEGSGNSAHQQQQQLSSQSNLPLPLYEDVF